MKKQIAQALYKQVQYAEEKLSGDRPGNTLKEEFKIDKVIPLSEHVAVAIFDKTQGKKALAVFYLWFEDTEKPKWFYFLPTDSHTLGLAKLPKFLEGIEKHNFKYNFKGGENGEKRVE